MWVDREGLQTHPVDEQTRLRVSSHGALLSYITERRQLCLSDRRQFGKLVCLRDKEKETALADRMCACACARSSWDGEFLP